MRFLNSKPRRSLYRLRLKFVQTTAEVSRKYYVLTNLSTRTYNNKYVYLRKCLPRTYFGEYVVLISCCCYRRAPTGRYSCIAQGTSPGLINGTHLLSPFRGGTPLSPTNARAESAAPHRSSYYLLFVFTQGSISGFALIPPWAMKSIVPTALVIRLNSDALVLPQGQGSKAQIFKIIILIYLHFTFYSIVFFYLCTNI